MKTDTKAVLVTVAAWGILAVCAWLATGAIDARGEAQAPGPEACPAPADGPERDVWR